MHKTDQGGMIRVQVNPIELYSIIRSRKSEKDIQHNGQKKKDK
jgi:hypothetical protein